MDFIFVRKRYNLIKRRKLGGTMAVRKITSEKMDKALRLKAIRESMDFTQEEFANKINISLSAYKKIESAENNISVNVLTKLKKEFHISSDLILYGEHKELNDAWYSVQNSSEEDKMVIYAKLMLHFLRKRNENVDSSIDEALDVTKKITDTKDI